MRMVQDGPSDSSCRVGDETERNDLDPFVMQRNGFENGTHANCVGTDLRQVANLRLGLVGGTGQPRIDPLVKQLAGLSRRAHRELTEVLVISIGEIDESRRLVPPHEWISTREIDVI